MREFPWYSGSPGSRPYAERPDIRPRWTSKETNKWSEYTTPGRQCRPRSSALPSAWWASGHARTGLSARSPRSPMSPALRPHLTTIWTMRQRAVARRPSARDEANEARPPMTDQPTHVARKLQFDTSHKQNSNETSEHRHNKKFGHCHKSIAGHPCCLEAAAHRSRSSIRRAVGNTWCHDCHAAKNRVLCMCSHLTVEIWVHRPCSVSFVLSVGCRRSTVAVAQSNKRNEPKNTYVGLTIFLRFDAKTGSSRCISPLVALSPVQECCIRAL